jgi:hypothetical protein
MLKEFFGWFDNFRMMMICLLFSFLCQVYITFNQYLNPPELKEFKGGIQNHLVWSNKGECFFVRPATGQTVYLIKVEDCNK